MRNNSSAHTNYPSKGLHLDYSTFSNSKDAWIYARNVTINTKLGDILHLQNEPSPTLCAEIPYDYIGHIPISENRKVIFSTDNTFSEIGILDANCNYTTLVNATCLNFHKNNPITGAYKHLYDCGDRIYWTDTNRNEIRILDLDDIPYTFTEANDECKTKTYTTDLDCEQLALTKKLNIPCVEINSKLGGSLVNGSYQVAVAYSSKNIRLTDYFSTTNPRQIWSHGNTGGSISVKISNLDPTFDEYQLLLISTYDNGQTDYFDLGAFSTKQTDHIITNKSKGASVQQEELSVKRPYYDRAESIVTNDQHLILKSPKTKARINYQPQAFAIKSKYVAYEVPYEYYENNNNVGYYRDEVYPFSIQWQFTDGQWSDAFHIAGRSSTASDLQIMTTNDVIDIEFNCEQVRPTAKWQVYNTAGDLRPLNGVDCDARIIGEGEMAYWESTELYPDNVPVYGQMACTPIRHHKFPDECVVPRSQATNKMTILGVKFENIQHPIDENGNKIPNIAGYRILRGDRQGNRSVIARGMFSNVRSYKEEGDTVKYMNYPYNSLSTDPFLSSTQTFNKNNGENGYTPLTAYSKDEFIFMSPHTLFDRISLGDYVQFESEEKSEVIGFFEDVQKHPKFKLLKDRVIWYALIIGAIDGYLKTFTGKRCEAKFTDGIVNATVASGAPPVVSTSALVLKNLKSVDRCNSILENGTGNMLSGLNKLNPEDVPHIVILGVLKTIATTIGFTYFASETAQNMLDIVYEMGGWQSYTKQYNSKGEFKPSLCIKPGNKRRALNNYQYLGSGINSLEDGTDFNNLYREDNVYLKLSAEVDELTGDSTLKTLSEFNICESPSAKVKSQAKMMYGTIRNYIPNQYGQLDTIRYIKTDGCLQSINTTGVYKSDVLFGGDCYLNLFSYNNKTDFFSHPLYDLPDGYEYDYRDYKAIAYPRYWIDSSKYNVLDIIPDDISDIGSNDQESNLPRQKYNLDCNTKDGFSFVKNEYMFTSVNSSISFLVESDYNLSHRDWKKAKPDFYTKNNNLSELFENKGSRDYEEFIYDKSYSKTNDDEFNYQQDLDFDPTNEECFTENPNTVAYSLASVQGQNYDNWLSFLPNDVNTFDQTQFGNLTSVNLVNSQQLLFLFDKSSPFITDGRTKLKSVDGTEIYLGTGSLIQNPYPITYTDDYYGNCQSKFAINHTKFGLFYPSQRKGNWFKYGQGLDEISRNGVFYHFDHFLPSQLLKQFPDYPHTDNPYNGIGIISVYDPSYEIIYLTKKDYCIKDEYKDQVTYNEDDDTFLYGNIPITFDDDTYFEDASWTISYSPSLKAFISFHDYQPNAYIPTENHFLAVKDRKIWKHNDNCHSFSNFYGVDYPHSFTLPVNSGQETKISRSVNYLSDVKTYQKNCKDEYDVLDETYDRAMIYNTTQTSGWLNLIEKKLPSDAYKYSKQVIGTDKRSFDILYNRDQQSFHFNQFSDIVKDRMSHVNIIDTDCSGYKWDLNPAAIDYKKTKRSKIRHSQSMIHLEKTVSNDRKYIFYLSNVKQLSSP